MTTTPNTPEGIRHFQLCQIKQRLKLEASGLNSHGPSALTQAKQHFGCKGNRAKVQEQIQALIDNSLAAKKYRGAGLYNCCKDFAPPDWTIFNGFEVMPLMWLPKHDCLEPINDAKDMHLVQFWTVYGHLQEGGVECITDCNTRKQAEDITDMFWREHGNAMEVACAIREARGVPKH